MRLYIHDVFMADPLDNIRLLDNLRTSYGEPSRDALGSFWNVDEAMHGGVWAIVANSDVHPESEQS